MNEVNEEIAQILTLLGIQKENLSWSTRITIIIGILLIAYLATKLFRHLIMPVIRKITEQTKATWDDYLFNDRMLKAFCRLIPPIVLHILMPFASVSYTHLTLPTNSRV